MFAADHRWQWEEWCDSAGIGRARIPEVKRLVLDAFLRARDRSEDVRRYGSLLLDNTYGGEAVKLASAAGVPVGTPVERAGVFPLQWDREPFYEGSSGNSFSKVLIRDRPEWDAAVRDDQFAKLLRLQAWCRAGRIPLLVEIIIMRQHEEERAFEQEGRPTLLAALIREAYARGLVPAIWKIEGTTNRDAAALVDAAVRERPEPRQVILGKGADAGSIAAWFDAAASLPSTAGFAIGRSVFMEPGTDYLKGLCTAEAAVQTMATRYLSLVDTWTAREQARA